MMSVLMPVWNRAGLVQGAIQSILDQTWQDWELVIIDDGSDDNTWNVLLKVRGLDARIKPFRFKSHMGLSEALIIGNQMCEGEIIVKQDSDDLSFPDRLEKIHRKMWHHKYDFFYHGIYQSWEEENVLRRIYIPAAKLQKQRILKEQYIPGFVAYTKRFITETPYRKTYCSDDWMLILDAFFRKVNIGFVDEGLYEYRLQEDSNSLYHENTGHYEKDEEFMREVLRKEYNIKDFHYASRNVSGNAHL